jgi:PRTRC genetic system ThiF family protein
MAYEHILCESLRNRRHAVKVLVIGAGGNGSAIFLQLPYLHQALRVWGHTGLHVELADGDLVSETNCVRQPFAAADVGANKATVLVNRVNLFWGLEWHASPHHFRSSSLKDYHAPPDVVISCVDTRAARATIAEALAKPRNGVALWLDLGNNAASGQYILGQPLNDRNRRKRSRLRTVVELYPEIASPWAGEDPLPSCSAIQALEFQEPYINQVLATSALAMMARLFRYGKIGHHGGFYNAETGRMHVMPVDPELWKRTSRRSRRFLKKYQRQAA